MKRSVWLFVVVPVMGAGSLLCLKFFADHFVNRVVPGDTSAFYVAATMSQEAPSDPYDSHLFSTRVGEITARFDRPIDGGMFWHYPPIGYFVVAPLALGTVASAKWIWWALNLAVFGIGVYVLSGRDLRALLLLAAPSTIGGLLMGQNSLLNTGLLGLALAFAQRSTALGGGALAVLSYKPHIATPLLLMWVFQTHFKALVAYLVVLGCLVAASILTFGWETWNVFGHTLWDALIHETGWADGLTDRNMSLFVLFQDLGWSHWIAALGSLTGACLVSFLLWRGRGLNVADPYLTLMLVTALPVLAPKAMDYDMALLLLPMLLLVQRGLNSGFRYMDILFILFAWFAVPFLRFGYELVELQLWPVVWFTFFFYGAYRSGVLRTGSRTSDDTA